ncbi:MAG: efflux transporter periplasmic adaptor subunit [Chitinophagaceae bacterium]
MKRIAPLLIVLALTAIGCGKGAKTEKAEITEKKTELTKLRKQQKEINDQIAKLEAEIKAADPTAIVNAKLVSVVTLANQDFNHYIQLQGRVDAQNISYVTPRGGPGQVKAVYVKQGDFVKKGQLLLKLDDAVILQNLKQLETQLAYAKNIYERQKNVWEQGIGTEVQYITAKNNVTLIERQIATLKEQWDLSNVRAEVSGVADEVNIHVGETFTGSPMQGIKIVNTSNLRVLANIPENYITRVRQGTPVQVVIPDFDNRIINSTVSVISQSIDPNSRGFIVEARISGTAGLKPNQTAIIKILDYTAKSSIVIPINSVQTDEKGRYVYVMEKRGNKMVATKKYVQVGEAYGEMTEVRAGLNSGDQLITEGYQNLYEGQVVAVANAVTKQ